MLLNSSHMDWRFPLYLCIGKLGEHAIRTQDKQARFNSTVSLRRLHFIALALVS